MKKTIKRILWVFLFLFVFVNAIAAIQAYKFTHFSPKGVRMEQLKLTPVKKMELLITGVDNPRPKNTSKPRHPYTTVLVKSNVNIECWHIKALKPARGTVILFHGYTANKSRLVERAEPFLQNGYNCLLVDFMGSGGSGGNATTIGYKEAQEVSDCYKYIQQKGEKNIYLYGYSMGAAAIMKAVHDNHIKPKAIIIACPFASMYETVAIRFKSMNAPSFPMAHILLFWGGVENGFWGYGHNPADYARDIHCPTLLQYGEKDERVARSEIDRIYKNLGGHKQLITYPLASHDDYMNTCRKEYCNDMVKFLKSNK